MKKLLIDKGQSADGNRYATLELNSNKVSTATAYILRKFEFGEFVEEQQLDFTNYRNDWFCKQCEVGVGRMFDWLTENDPDEMLDGGWDVD